MTSTQLIELHPADWAVIGLYIAALFVIAFRTMRNIRDCGGFLLGKRKMGKLMMMACTFAGGTNANHPIAVAAATFRYGLSGLWLSMVWMLITPFFWMYPPVLRRLRNVTIVDLVQLRFGRLMSTIFKLVGIVGTTVSMGLGIKSAAIVVEVMSGGALKGVWAMALITLPTVLYSLMGGVVAAYATDALQGGLIIILSFLMIPFAIRRAGGIAELNAAISDEMTYLIAHEGTAGFGFWWIFWFTIGILFSATLSTGGGASSARNELAARSQIFGLITKRFCTVGWGMVGLLAVALYAGHAHLAARPDDVFPLMAGDLLPVILRGLMVASILAAAMSSLDGMMIGFSGMMVNNIYREHFVRRASPRHYLIAARIFAVLGVLAGWWVASGVRSLVEFSTLVEPFNGLTGMAVLVALLWRRTTKWGAITSVLVMCPLFTIGNTWTLPEGVASLPWGIRHAVVGMVDLYAAIGHQVEIPMGADAYLPVQLKNPLYILPGLATLILVSLLTRQHDDRAVREFYGRLDTPLGEEHKLREAGFQADDLERLDQASITVEAADRDISRRLLLPDLLRLPRLLARGEARLSDYKLDWIGIIGSIIFVALFLFGVERLGALFRSS